MAQTESDDPSEVRAGVQAILKAAEADYPPALLMAGAWRQTGEHGPEDGAQARALYQRAAEAGSAAGWRCLGILLQVGLGGSADVEKAAQAYAKGARQGDGKAALNLAALHLSSKLKEASIADAEHWYRVAYKNGAKDARQGLAQIRALQGYGWLIDEPPEKPKALWRRILGLPA